MGFRIKMRRRTQPGSAINAVLLCAAIALTPPLISPASAADRTKTDILVMKNGDRITCEITKLDHGQLSIKTNYAMGTIVVNWEEVERVESKQPFILETTKGRYFTGTIETDKNKGDAIDVINTGQEPVRLAQDEIVEARQLGESFLNRLSYTIDYGLNYTRSNTQTQSNLASTFDYRSPRKWLTLNMNSLFTTQENADDTNRQQATVGAFQRIRSTTWFGGAIGDMLRNTAQDLDLRYTLGGGMGKPFIATNRSYLVGLAGLVYTNERYANTSANPQSPFSSMESTFNVQYSTFRFDSSQFVTSAWVYPSLTNPGRVRINFDASLYLDLAHDLYLRLGYFHNFDSRPPTDTLRNDYGFSTSVGWKF